MANPSLGAVKATWKSGTEPFHRNGDPAGFDLLDFWRWGMSDLVSNTARGILAEYIVAKALGISTACAREEWGSYDLCTSTGCRVEVKSSAYIQSWTQNTLSAIQFVVPKRRGWDPQTNVMEDVPRRHADVYVFALLAHTDKATIDPLDLTQWRFWAVPTRSLDERSRSQHSITLRSLEALAGKSVDYRQLGDAVERAFSRRLDRDA